jgi:putative ABC transport system permease protein
VAQRTREIGVRSALGARPTDIAATIARRAALQLGIGVLLGMPLAGRVYYLTQENPAAKGAAVVAAVVPATLVLLLLAAVACSAPLARALRIQPTEALKGEGQARGRRLLPALSAPSVPAHVDRNGRGTLPGRAAGAGRGDP